MTALGPGDIGDLVDREHDLIVVGGGIYGAMAHLEAARRGLRSVLLEEHDFGGATSANSLRIIHGGLRYLQSFDLRRCFESTRERQWFFNHMRPLVRTLPCLVPLYGRGLKRASVMRAALWLNTQVAAAAGRGGGADVPRGGVIDAAATRQRFAGAGRANLEGAGVWSDLAMPCPSRVLIEALRWARQLGGAARNYARAQDLLVERGRVRGLTVADERTGAIHELRASAVINAAGAGVRTLAARWDRDVAELFHPAAAWNVLFDRPPLSDHAVALGADGTHPLLFATPLGGRLAVGTGHVPLAAGELGRWEGVVDEALDGFIAAINACVPELRLTRSDIVHVYAGLMPACRPGEGPPRTRSLVHDHGAGGGPKGLFSVSGVKFTTARAAAEAVLARVERQGAVSSEGRVHRGYPPVHSAAAEAIFPDDRTPHTGDLRWRRVLERIIEEESVVHLDDLLLRRTNLGDDPARTIAIAPELCALQDAWRSHAASETARVVAALRHAPLRAPSVPAESAALHPRGA